LKQPSISNEISDVHPLSIRELLQHDNCGVINAVHLYNLQTMLHTLAARTGPQAANLPWKLVRNLRGSNVRATTICSIERKTFPEIIIEPVKRSPLRIAIDFSRDKPFDIKVCCKLQTQLLDAKRINYHSFFIRYKNIFSSHFISHIVQNIFMPFLPLCIFMASCSYVSLKNWT